MHMLKLFLLNKEIDKSDSTFTFSPKDFCFGKYSDFYTMSFLSIQLLKEQLPFLLTYGL